jgi:hypothetical protein
MLDKEPAILKDLIQGYDTDLTVIDNDDRTLNIKSTGDIHDHIQAINNAMHDWLGRDLVFPIQLIYETFYIDRNTCLIKV